MKYIVKKRTRYLILEIESLDTEIDDTFGLDVSFEVCIVSYIDDNGYLDNDLWTEGIIYSL